MADATPTNPSSTPTAAPTSSVSVSPWILGFIAFNSVAGLLVALVVGLFLFHQDHPSAPTKPYDEAFVKVGESYGGHLAETCGTAWSEAADLLDSGQPYSTALSHAAASWSSGRQQFFDQIVTPELGKIVPEATKDADVTAAQRVKASSAWRGFAKGLGAQ